MEEKYPASFWLIKVANPQCQISPLICERERESSSLFPPLCFLLRSVDTSSSFYGGRKAGSLLPLSPSLLHPAASYFPRKRYFQSVFLFFFHPLRSCLSFTTVAHTRATRTPPHPTPPKSSPLLGFLPPCGAAFNSARRGGGGGRRNPAGKRREVVWKRGQRGGREESSRAQGGSKRTEGERRGEERRAEKRRGEKEAV